MKRKFSSDDDMSNKRLNTRHNTRHNKHFFIAPKELWSDEKAISKIVNDHQNHLEKGDLMRLVVCHGRQHEKYDFLPDYEKTLFLDIDPDCEPDFIGDINCLDFARRFPRESFDEIYTAHMPMELPEDNFATWKVFLHLLKPGGKVYLDGIIWQFSHRGPTVGTHRWYPLKRAISVHLTGQCDHHCLFHSVEFRNVSFFKRIKVYHPNRNSQTQCYSWEGMVIATK